MTLPLPDGRLAVRQNPARGRGQDPLLLLDSTSRDNHDAARNVTDRLHGRGSDHRLQQEPLLGMVGRARCVCTAA
ncbi:hypothetical protein QJS66_09500 [Kocuria rhizophila]|nr:hypothetical protein QJS66_09500 [Kocuria rhizophila]